MKSDVLKIAGDLSNITDVLDRVELYARASDLSEKSKRYMRLLAEEMLTSVTRILPDSRSSIWVESDDKAFYTHLVARASIEDAEREKLIAISSSGVNTAPKGFFAKLSFFMNSLYDTSATTGAFMSDAGMSHFTSFDMGVRYSPLTHSYTWSYDTFKQEAAPDEMEGIERTLIENCADDVQVTAQFNAVEITAVRYFNRPEKQSL